MSQFVTLSEFGHLVYYARPKVTASFSDPSDLAGLKGWWDCAETGSLSKTGDLVDQWDDQSGNGEHMTSSDTARPDSSASRQQNSINVIDFVPVEYMDSGTWASVSQPWVLYTVGAFDATGDTMIDGAANNALIQRTATIFRASAGTNLAGGSGDNSWHVFGLFANGASSYFRIDGSEYSGDAGSDAITGLRIGTLTAGGQYLNGAIAEVFFASGNEYSKVDDIESYLGTKWDITIS